MGKMLKKRRKGIMVITLAVLALFAVLFTRARAHQREKAILTARYDQLQAKYETVKEKAEELKDKEAYMSTIGYIEDVAREKLGLVYEDEVIFREKDEDSEEDN